MINLGDDLTEKLLNGYSWVVTHESYDLGKRIFSIGVEKEPDSNQHERELRWLGVRSINILIEESDIDDDCMNSIIGIQERNIDGLYNIYIQTDKHGISLVSENGVSINDC
jgi:hypothetical protein